MKKNGGYTGKEESGVPIMMHQAVLQAQQQDFPGFYLASCNLQAMAVGHPDWRQYTALHSMSCHNS